MTRNPRSGTRIPGRLRSEEGKGVVRFADRYDTNIDDLCSALTLPGRLARWIGQVDDDLRLGGQFHVDLSVRRSLLSGRALDKTPLSIAQR